MTVTTKYASVDAVDPVANVHRSVGLHAVDAADAEQCRCDGEQETLGQQLPPEPHP